eukprot:TCONS_00043267-protein
MRYLLPPPPNSKVQYPVIIFCGYQSDMKSLLKVNSGYLRRVKQRFHLADYTPEDLWCILEGKLLAINVRYPYGLGPNVIKCFKSLPSEYISLNNASLADDLLNDITSAQEERLAFSATKSELTKLTVGDFTSGIDTFLSKLQEDHKVEVRRLVDKLTQMPEPVNSEVILHIKGVGLVPGSPTMWQRPFKLTKSSTLDN